MIMAPRHFAFAFGISFMFVVAGELSAQNPKQFEHEVNAVVAHDSALNKQNLIVFAGSSSIRLWKNLKGYFPGKNITNHGFGGSHTADLLYYCDRLIIAYHPVQVFIYEGDNDIAAGRSVDQIIQTAEKLIDKIHEKLPQTEIVYISAKPSLARWSLKDTYLSFNRELQILVKRKKNTRFLDVWTPMLGRDGKVLPDIFIEDGLHLNKKGYDIWGKVLAPYVRSR
jgi:lysophospholipase L1-like esterase